MEETLVPQAFPDPPKVSIVIVTRNQEAGLARCLSALRQSTLAVQTEIIVVDNRSTDGSSALQDDHEAVTYLKLPKNFGWTKAANIALRSAQAELILFLDPRVELAPASIERMVNTVQQEGETAAACAWLTEPDGTPVPLLRKLPTKNELRPAFFSPIEGTTGPIAVEYPGAFALLIRKSFLKGMNFLDERYGELWADAEIAAQVKRAGCRILLVREAPGNWHAKDSAPAIHEALLEADFEQGAATFLGKHHGGGLGRRAAAALAALGTLKLGLLSNLLSGQKVDGTQE